MDVYIKGSLMNCPDNKECIRLLRQKGVPIHIIRHCSKVSIISLKICHNLLSKGIKMDINLVRAGALLHDISKMESIKHGGDHAEMGASFLSRLGYHRVAEIVRQHVVLDRPVDSYEEVTEELLVNYVDKRVMHTRVVSLEDRFSDIFARYGKGDDKKMEKLQYLYNQARLMEDMIFSRIDIVPEEIV